MKKSDLIKLSIAQIGNSMSFMVMFLFFPIYMINNIFHESDIANTLSFSILSISVTFGAITFIFAGYFSDKTRTRFGKRRPYFLLVIPSAIAFIFLGFPFSSIDIISTFIILVVIATIYAVLYRLVLCTYWSLYMDLTNPEERITTSIIYNLFGTIGTVLTLILIPILELVLDFFMITLIVGLIFMISVLFGFFFGPKEDLDKIKEDDAKGVIHTTLIHTLKDTLSNRNFAKYLLATFFFVLGFQVSVLILMPYVESQSISLLWILPFLIPFGIFCFLLFSRIARSWGHLKAFRFVLIVGFITVPIAIFLGVVGTGVIMFIQVFATICLILFVVIAVLCFQYAVLMDLTPSGHEATYSGVYMFVIAIPIPIASALIGPILDFFSIDVLGFWTGQSFSYAIIFLITAIFLAVSYLFLRMIQNPEDIAKISSS